jgi:predicted secreted Zn-dependent protease
MRDIDAPKRVEPSPWRPALRAGLSHEGKWSRSPGGAGLLSFVRVSRQALASLGVFLLPLLANGQSTFVWTTNYYVVTGSTMREIMESMDQARPAKIAAPMMGCTEWRMMWRFAVVPSTGGCRCASFSTRLVITNTLPRWTPPTNATPELKAAWQRLFWNLAQHEGGHSEIALAALAEVHRRVKELPDDPDCDGLRPKVNAMIQGVLDEYHRLDGDFDQRTQHGRWSGVAVPYSPTRARKEP